KHLKYVFDYYKSLDFKVALDDVGSGYSGLNMIVNLHPDTLKIDMELVRNIHTDKLKQSVVEAIIKIAKDNGIQTLAEGVETKDEYEYLKDKVDLMQGYLFAKPSPEPIFEVSLN
ncbi:MAG: EAL domain-containing protein, partial [Hydrogenothermaceae bacterium]